MNTTGAGEPPALVTMAADTWAEHLAARTRLEQQLVKAQAELKQANEHADNCTDIVLDQYQRAEQAEAERDAARAALRLLRNGIAEAAICLTEPLDMLPCVTPERRIKAAAGTLESLLADPQGQQAAVEWQRLKAVANAAKEHEDAKERYSQAMRERDFDVAAAAQSDELHAHTALLTALAALRQQQPAAEERQQNG